MKIALVTFGDPWLLPPTLAAAELLARSGFSVEILAIQWLGLPQLGDRDPPGVRTRILGTVSGGIRYTPSWLRFFALCLGRARSERYDWVYAYDMMAAPIGRAMAAVARGRFAYHCHDLASDEDLTRQQRLLGSRRMELSAGRAADLVVFPQAERARIFATEARLDQPPVIAWNCPLRDWAILPAPLDGRVAAMKARYPKLVLYQGGLGADRGTNELIDSLPYWPEDVGLVIAGFDAPSGRVAALEERLRRLDMSARVLWIAPLPFRLLPSVTRGCEVGVLLSAPGQAGNINLRHHAGASNKIFEYMACGLRVIAPDTTGFAELIEAPGYGRICRDRSPQAIALLIADLVSPRYEEMGRRNAQACRDRLNYETQFAPVIELLGTLKDSGRTSTLRTLVD